MNQLEHLLTCAIEEAAEVQKELCKCLRFGWRYEDPRRPGVANIDSLRQEVIDLIAVLQMLEEVEKFSVLPKIGSRDRIEAKKIRVSEMMEIAKERGALTFTK